MCRDTGINENHRSRSVEDCRIIRLPRIQDPRGNLTYIEGNRHLNFDIKRVYWIYDVPGGAFRAGHAFYELHEFFISLSGSFDVVLDDGSTTKTHTLNRSYFGLYVPNMLWRFLTNFSTNSVCLVLASTPYSAEDYIDSYSKYCRLIQENLVGDNC
jgi:hypothetical protein